MARDIDDVIKFVQERPGTFTPIMAQVIINRLDPPPTQEEIDKAKTQVSEKDAWKNKRECHAY